MYSGGHRFESGIEYSKHPEVYLLFLHLFQANFGIGKWLMWCTEGKVNVLRLSKGVVKWSEGKGSEGG